VASVPAGPGVLYPAAPDVMDGTRSFDTSYDFLRDGTGRVVSSNPNARWARGANPAPGGEVNFQLAPERVMREPGTYGPVS